MLNILNKFFGSKSERDRKELSPVIDKVNAEYVKLESLTNDELRAKTTYFKERIAEHLKSIETEINELEQKAESDFDMDLQEKEDIYRKVDQLKKDRNKQIEEILNELLPEAFAVVKETAKRFAQSSELTATANQLDRDLAARKDNVRIEGDMAVYSNEWLAAGNLVKDRKSTRLNSSHRT